MKVYNTNSEYHSGDGVSKSDLFLLSKSPEYFKWYKEHPKPKTSELVFGSAFHKLVLEPETFSDEFTVIEKIDKRTKAGKEAAAKLESRPAATEQVPEPDYAVMCTMRNKILSNKYAAELLNGEHEISYYWTDELTGELCKCRPDIVWSRNGKNIIADLKTCASADTDSFTLDCIRYGYDLQAAMYKEGLERATGGQYTFVFIAAEKKEPYGLNILQADEIFIRRGYDLFRQYLGIYHRCKETGNWYGYNGFSGYINNLSLPRWLAADYE